MTKEERNNVWSHQKGISKTKESLQKRHLTKLAMSQKERSQKWGTAKGKQWFHNPCNPFDNVLTFNGLQPIDFVPGRGKIKNVVS